MFVSRCWIYKHCCNWKVAAVKPVMTKICPVGYFWGGAQCRIVDTAANSWVLPGTDMVTMRDPNGIQRTDVVISREPRGQHGNDWGTTKGTKWDTRD